MHALMNYLINSFVYLTSIRDNCYVQNPVLGDRNIAVSKAEVVLPFVRSQRCFLKA